VGVLDLFFPKYCVSCRILGSYICSDCFAKISFTTGGICLACNRASLDGLTHPPCLGTTKIDGTFASVVYEGVVKKLVYTFKYKPYVTGLKKTLVDLFHEGIIQHEALFTALKKDSVFVPIPLHQTKYKRRGYNQAALLAHGLSEKLGVPICNALYRHKKTESQFGLQRADRLQNIKDAFSLDEKEVARLKDKTVFLVDDVVTSGATLSEAAHALKKQGVQRVYGVALAHGQ
jgi:competence protein ComFC